MGKPSHMAMTKADWDRMQAVLADFPDALRALRGAGLTVQPLTLEGGATWEDFAEREYRSEGGQDAVMSAKPTCREPTEEEHAALEAFAAAHGCKWREELTLDYWLIARLWIGPEPDMGRTLHAIRNEFGPVWLYNTYQPRPRP